MAGSNVYIPHSSEILQNLDDVVSNFLKQQTERELEETSIFEEIKEKLEIGLESLKDERQKTFDDIHELLRKFQHVYNLDQLQQVDLCEKWSDANFDVTDEEIDALYLKMRDDLEKRQAAAPRRSQRLQDKRARNRNSSV